MTSSCRFSVSSSHLPLARPVQLNFSKLFHCHGRALHSRPEHCTTYILLAYTQVSVNARNVSDLCTGGQRCSFFQEIYFEARERSQSQIRSRLRKFFTASVPNWRQSTQILGWGDPQLGIEKVNLLVSKLRKRTPSSILTTCHTVPLANDPFGIVVLRKWIQGAWQTEHRPPVCEGTPGFSRAVYWDQ